MGDRHTSLEDPMFFLNALNIFFILNSLMPFSLDTLYHLGVADCIIKFVF